MVNKIVCPDEPGITRRDFLATLPLAAGALLLARCSQVPTTASPAPASTSIPTNTITSTSPTPPGETDLLPSPSETSTTTPGSPPEYLPLAEEISHPLALPAAQFPASASLSQALQERRSRREFASADLPVAVIASLLWAGFGVNRSDGKRTAPSAYNVMDIDLYLATAMGLFRYDPSTHSLVALLPDDLRPFTGTQGFAATAPLNLVYVSDYSRINASEQECLQWSWAHTGCIAQNVYLACAALGLATVLRSTLNRPDLAERMGLNAQQHITMAQSIGYPA